MIACKNGVVKWIFHSILQAIEQPPLTFPGENGKDMRDLLWFVLPSEVCLKIDRAENLSPVMSVPFIPKDYDNPCHVHHLGHTHPLNEKHGSMRNGMVERRSGKLSKGIAAAFN